MQRWTKVRVKKKINEEKETGFVTNASLIDLDFDNYAEYLKSKGLPPDTDLAEVKLVGDFNWSVDFDFSGGTFEGFSILVPNQTLEMIFRYYDEKDEEQEIRDEIVLSNVKVDIDLTDTTATRNYQRLDVIPKSILWGYSTALVSFG